VSELWAVLLLYEQEKLRLGFQLFQLQVLYIRRRQLLERLCCLQNGVLVNSCVIGTLPSYGPRLCHIRTTEGNSSPTKSSTLKHDGHSKTWHAYPRPQMSVGRQTPVINKKVIWWELLAVGLRDVCSASVHAADIKTLTADAFCLVMRNTIGSPLKNATGVQY
jgi:hypothetical protein